MQSEKTKHDKILEWIISQLPENTEYKKEEWLHSNFDSVSGDYLWKVVPDLFIDEKEIIEVEITKIKKENYKNIPFKKSVYIIIDKKELDSFDDTIIALWEEPRLKLLTSITDEEHVEALKNEKVILKEQIESLNEYLEEYEPKTLATLRKEELRLKLSIENLKKQKILADGISMLGATKEKPLVCSKCPFFSSWIKEAYKKEFKNEITLPL